MFEAGAGHIGTYDQCSFNLEGKGYLQGIKRKQSFVGEAGQIHQEPETRVEIIVSGSRSPGK